MYYNTVHPTDRMIGDGPVDIMALDNVHKLGVTDYGTIEKQAMTIHGKSRYEDIPLKLDQYKKPDKFDFNKAPETGWDIYVDPRTTKPDTLGLLFYNDYKDVYKIKLR